MLQSTFPYYSSSISFSFPLEEIFITRQATTEVNRMLNGLLQKLTAESSDRKV
jgi:hypothetical protein